MGGDGGREEALSLFETKEARGRVAYKLFSSTIFMGICLIWFYRLINIPRSGEEGRWAWIGLFVAEFWFGLYWIITQSVRWNVVYRYPFKERLLHRYGDKLPRVDIFVCTADHIMEPPTLVINTVLSVMSYNYPPEKISVYLSDDEGSELTFYALLEASNFSKHWIPFCKKFMMEPRSPAAYFAQHTEPHDTKYAQEWLSIKKLYESMKNRIDSVVEMGCISKEMRDQHKGFLEWNSKVTKWDHQSIVQIIIDGRNTAAVDNDGCRLPTLVYVAREKRPQWPHNFKAGAMNALIRVSSEISNGAIILNVDCDMYSNNPDAIQEALCFFMDEERGHEISYVQFPQNFCNITENDVYSNATVVFNKVIVHKHDLRLCFFVFKNTKLFMGTDICFLMLVMKIEVPGIDGYGTVFYLMIIFMDLQKGLIYGCSVEDVITGLAIQCRGWKSVWYNPGKEAFLGVAPTTLDQALIQYMRWSEGMFQIFLSKYCPFLYGHGKIKLAAQMGYCVYLLWAPISLPTLYYVIVPPLCLLRGIPLFPENGDKKRLHFFIRQSYWDVTNPNSSRVGSQGLQNSPCRVFNVTAFSNFESKTLVKLKQFHTN
ncbi:hypothetical protein L1049_001543 [Liquidambar formosana]|uniref:Cellulose synthase-like protein E6 n=1 Tax=Liquidambar formosana TaxID=63359 RepID=A0AAP0NDG8_LIQFO